MRPTERRMLSEVEFTETQSPVNRVWTDFLMLAKMLWASLEKGVVLKVKSKQLEK